MTEVPLVDLSRRVELPFARVDALLVLGIGGNVQLKGPHKRPVVEERRMRINAIATKEITVNGHLPTEAVIIPTGKGN